MKPMGRSRIRRSNRASDLQQGADCRRCRAGWQRHGRIRMARIPDFDRATLHGFIRSSVEPRSAVCTDGLNSYREMEGYIHHRQASAALRTGNTCCPESTGRSPAQAMDARNPSGSHRSPTPRRLSQRVRLPLQPTKVSLARQALLPVGQQPSRSPRRPTKGWCGHKMLHRLSQVNSPINRRQRDPPTRKYLA